jgi:hypothetical protein
MCSECGIEGDGALLGERRSYTPAEVSRIIAQIIGIHGAKTSAATTVYDPTRGSGSRETGNLKLVQLALNHADPSASTPRPVPISSLSLRSPSIPGVYVEGDDASTPAYTTWQSLAEEPHRGSRSGDRRAEWGGGKA